MFHTSTLKTISYFLLATVINTIPLFIAVIIIGFNDSGATFSTLSGLVWAVEMAVLMGGLMVSPIYLLAFYLGRKYLAFFQSKVYWRCGGFVFFLLFGWYLYTALFIY